MNKRIKDLAATATSPAGDDFLALDGAGNGTRKINASVIGASNDLPIPLPTFVSGGTYGTQSITGDIPNNWKQDTDIAQLYIGNSATSIGDYAFSNCVNITGYLTIPNSVTSIGSYAFAACSGFNGALAIGNSVTSIGQGAFTSCVGFTGSLVIPDSVTNIGSFAFYYCSGFTGSLIIPDSVTTIGSLAFSSCTALTEIVIPDSVTSIGSAAFAFCNSLIAPLVLKNPAITLGTQVFQTCTFQDAYLNVPFEQFPSNTFEFASVSNIYIGPDATGWTLGSGQDILGLYGVTVSEWTNYPNVP